MLKHFLPLGIVLTLGTSSLLFAEPSVYGTNSEEFKQQFYADIDAPEPVAAPTIQQPTVQQPPTLISLKRQIERQNERIDGLTTLVEGLSAQLLQLQQQKSVSASASGTDNTGLLQKLGEMIDRINSNYVSKEELEQILASMGTVKKTVPVKEKAVEKKEESLDGKENASLYKEGVKLFGKKRYDEAKKRFTITDQKGYKPAASNYYLGEIAYYTKAYEDAIFYYKKSAGLYDKANYIDVLLLHAGISLEKTGKKDQAKLFYQNIVDNYGGKKSAKIAKEKLKKL